jgi:hydroxymethylbilane synthase
MPIGVLAEPSGAELRVKGIVVSPDGTRVARATATGSRDDAERLGVSVADELLRNGAGDILADVQRTHAAVEGIQP